MMPPAAEPIRKAVVVNVGVDEAFRMFTERFDAIKPRDHNLLGVPIAETVFEPYVGGHIYGVGTNGSCCEWARVRVCESPIRVVFSWNIGPDWQLETDPDRTSEVEIRFIDESAQWTGVELKHRHLDRHGTGWRSVADGIGGDAGWVRYLHRYVDLGNGETAL